MLNKITASVSLLLAVFVLTTKCHRISSLGLQDLNLQGAEPEPEFWGAIQNVTYPAGREAVLTCSVNSLGNYKVGWLRASDQTVLALHTRVVTNTDRISVSHEDKKTWRLRIRQLREQDKGCYMCQINFNPMKKQIGCIDVQVQPDISNDDSSNDVAVREGDDAVLYCKATGNPLPRVTWRREDNEPILMRRPGGREMHKVENYTGTTLRLPKVERRQMGAYLCIANNNVPPSVSKRVTLSVHFLPLISAPNQLLGAPYGSDVTLICNVESSPYPVFYWLRGRGKEESVINLTDTSRAEMLLEGPKYSLDTQTRGYKTIMKLTVKQFSASDCGRYHCISGNSLGKTEGTVRLYEIKVNEHARASDSVNLIAGLAEVRGSRGNSQQLMATKTLVLLLTFLGVFSTTSHAR